MIAPAEKRRLAKRPPREPPTADNLIAAYAESACGPGWANAPVWVLWRELGGRYRLDALQPDEQSGAVRSLYTVSAAAHGAMTRAVRALLRDGK